MRIIAHLDLDAFFASVEERDNPQFKGMPIVIGADPHGGHGRGVVSTANYKAREYGIGSAMPVSRAWQASEKAKLAGKPPVIFLPGDIEKYSAISGKIFKIIQKYSDVIEPASIDEAYFDLSMAGSYGQAEKIARKIKKVILKSELITASVGIGPNKLIAKIASGANKPDGLTVITKAKAEKFLELMSVRAIPGIGPKTESVFKSHGIKLVKDLKKLSISQLSDLVGKWGASLYANIRGVDDAPLITEWEAKSIGEQETFMKDTLLFSEISRCLVSLCKGVIARMVEGEFKTFKTAVLTVRFEDFQTLTRSSTYKEPVSGIGPLRNEIFRLIMPFLDKRQNPDLKKIRLLGVRIEKLSKV